MQKVMGASDFCILRGHGLIVAGSSVEQATITAIKVDTLARMNLQAASIGKVPTIPDEDIEQFQRRTGRGNSSPEACGDITANGLSRVENHRYKNAEAGIL